MLKLTPAAIAEMFAQRGATRRGRREDFFYDSASVAAFRFDNANANSLIWSREGNKNRQALVPGDGFAAVCKAICLNFDDIADFDWSIIHSFTIAG